MRKLELVTEKWITHGTEWQYCVREKRIGELSRGWLSVKIEGKD